MNQAAGFKRRPLLFLDADGPLDPFAAKPTRRPDGYQTHRMAPRRWMEAERERLCAEGRLFRRANYAAGRPFAWVDDQITMADWRGCATRHPAPTLLQPIHPARGLTAGDFAALGRWARLNQQADPAPVEGVMP